MKTNRKCRNSMFVFGTRPTVLMVMVILLLSGSGQAAIVELLAHYSFDEDTYDVVSGTVDDVAVGDIGNNQIQEIGSGVTMGVPGIVGTAAYFDGRYYSAGGGGSNNVYLKAPTNQLYGPGRDDLDGMAAMSLTAWVLPTEEGFMNSLGGPREIIRIDNSVFADPVYLLRFSDMGGSTISLEFGLTNDKGLYKSVKAVLPGIPRDDFFDGRWHIAGGVYDGEWMQVYWDGSPLGSPVPMGGTVKRVNDHALEIGNFPFAESWEPFRGAIDEVKIYSGAIPEPATMFLLGLGGLALLRKRKK